MKPAAWLGLAAAPTFALMAATTAVLDAKAAGSLCSSEHAPISGMVTMYLLMGLFHLGPWLARAAP